MEVGYACICLGRPELRSQRTTMLRHATPQRLGSLIAANIEGLEQILEYNETRGLRLFRIGGQFIPFASHPVNALRWWEEYSWRLRGVGRWATRHGHRLSFHASHFTLLNSENPSVVDASIADLIYHHRVLEAMELGPRHRIVLHVGTSKPGYPEAEDRFARALERVPAAVRARLSLENDERFYSIDRVVALGERLGLPVILDLLHHACRPGAWADLPCDELLRRVFATWSVAQSPPKIHFSTQDPEKKPGAHGYWVDPGELEAFLTQSAAVATDFDILFEAKGKDLAVERVLPILRGDARFGGAKTARETVAI